MPLSPKDRSGGSTDANAGGDEEPAARVEATRARLKAALLALLPVVLLTPPLVWLAHEFAAQLADAQRTRVRHALEIRADAVQGSLDRIVGKLDSLADFVMARTQGGRPVSDEQFDTFASGLHASAAWIRAFQVVTDGVITQTYPLKGNEAILGYNLLKDPRPVLGGDVLRAERTGRVTITGPIDLVQGGLGLIVRKPLPHAPGTPARLVAVVFNLAPMLADARFGAEGGEDAAVAIRQASGAAFFGSPAVFDQQPVIRRLTLPDGAWEIGACPRRGWAATVNPSVLRYELAGAAIILLLGLLVYVLAASRGLLTATVRERTRELSRELAARQQAEAELRRHYALLRAVTEGTSDAVFAKGRDGAYRMINTAGAAYVRRSPEEIIGRTDRDLFTAESAAAILEQDRQVMESGQARTFEGDATGAGVTRTYQATKAPWRDEQGRVIGIIGVSRDITERKRMDVALRESERQLSVILDNVSDVIFAIAVEPGDQFRFTSVNRRFLEATGLAESQIVGALVRDIIPEPGRSVALQKYHEAIESGQPAHWDEVSEYPAGRKIGHVTIVPVRDARGVCMQLVGMVHDITDRKQAEEALRASEAHYRELFENNPAPMLIYELGGLQLLAVNEAFARHYGYSRAEALALRLPDLHPAPDRTAVAALARQLQGSASVSEWQHRKRDGSPITIVARSHELAFADRPCRIVVLNDITERRAAEEARRTSEAQVRALLVAADCLLWQAHVTRSGPDRFDWKYYIPRSGLYRRLYGVDPGELAALHWDDLGVPELPEMHARYLQALSANAPGYVNEFHALVGGQTIWLHEQVSISREAESAWLLVGVITDVTEKKRTEEEIRKFTVELEQRVDRRTAELAVARDRAEAADRLKSAFLATMSHELRTPLNSIIGFTGILLQGLPGPVNPEQRKQLDMVRASARHLLALINDVLDISKIEAGQLEIANEAFDLRQAIERVIGLIRPLAEAKGLALQVDLPPAIGPWRGDQRRVEQVLLNLLNNAVKFTEHGAVSLAITRAANLAELPGPSVRGRPTASYGSAPPFAPGNAGPVVQLAVRDTGIGIRAEHLAMLFQPFQQIDTGLTRQHEGTGLGLAICRRLAALMGGAIRVESEWGAGSVFTVTLPFGTPRAQIPAPWPGSVPPSPPHGPATPSGKEARSIAGT